jgi:hypothetical protein
MDSFKKAFKKAFFCTLIASILLSLPEFITANNRETEAIIKGFLYILGGIIGYIGILEFKNLRLPP